ncbi:hypothetical protein [Streptomyces sp. PSKA30]|uniref:hypothetical protein n=1 Tax=Streptomyces sp. PSKA30 TaxID=2874597 RepID=UPI001CD18229|nr:hypothetical protein [Streptomyces sp. PSKA30]MBZ9640386.1 hypothetical protein [Streptomyces sp. PSKA30]
MRLCTPVSLCTAASAAVLFVAGPAYSGSAPGCAAGSGGRDFPITTRIHGGPDSYDAGGGYGTWSIDLTNSTARTCTGIHPVVVLVDKGRTLTPTQPKLEFYEKARPHPVRFERTDEDELVGAFDGFAGFTVPPGRTLTVRVRLALTSDAVPNEITANAAVVQRRDNDGDWVGQSNDYRFRVEVKPDTGSSAEPEPKSGSDSGTPTAPASAGSTPAPDGRLSFADELARTGLGTTRGALGAAAVLLVAAGCTLVLVRRRR